MIDVTEASQSSRIFRMALGSSQTLGHQIKAWLGRCCTLLNPPTPKLSYFLESFAHVPCCGMPFFLPCYSWFVLGKILLLLICFGETFSYSQLVDDRVFFETSPKPSTQDNTLWWEVSLMVSQSLGINHFTVGPAQFAISLQRQFSVLSRSSTVGSFSLLIKVCANCSPLQFQ